MTTLTLLMKAEGKRLMKECKTELTNTLLFSSENGSAIGTATITVNRYEIKDITVAIFKDDGAEVVKGKEINPYFTVNLLTKREYKKALEEKMQVLREKACERYFEGVN